MNSANQPLTKTGAPRQRAPGAGRPPKAGMVRLNCRIPEETRAALGDKPGETITRLVDAAGLK